jgi:hypothetical protein
MTPNITIAALDTMGADEIAELPAAVLLDLQDELERFVESAQQRADRFRHALDLRYGQDASLMLAGRQAESGTIRVMDHDAQNVCEVEIPKTVSWDQGKLSVLWDRITANGDDPAVYMKRTLAVSETALKSWPAAVQAEFSDARSYKHGRYRFNLRKAKGTEDA